MEWLNRLRGSVIGLDTAPLIYFIEEHPDYDAIVNPFFEALHRREFRAVTSTITLTEVFVHPFRQSDQNFLQQYTDILLYQESLATVAVTPAIATQAAQLRVQPANS